MTQPLRSSTHTIPPFVPLADTLGIAPRSEKTLPVLDTEFDDKTPLAIVYCRMESSAATTYRLPFQYAGCPSIPASKSVVFALTVTSWTSRLLESLNCPRFV